MPGDGMMGPMAIFWVALLLLLIAGVVWALRRK